MHNIHSIIIIYCAIYNRLWAPAVTKQTQQTHIFESLLDLNQIIITPWKCPVSLGLGMSGKDVH